MTAPSPEWVAAWEAEEAESTRQFIALVNRLGSDLDAFPDSPTLNTLATRDHEGRVVGGAGPSSVLGMAYLNGAPAWLIVAAEGLTDFIGRHGCRGHLHRAVRLDALRRRMNDALRPYLGRNALGTLTVRLPLNRPERAAVALPAVLDTPERAEAVRLVDTDADPPPLNSPALAPLLRTGPPASPVVRPRPAAPVLAARRSERWTVSRAA